MTTQILSHTVGHIGYGLMGLTFNPKKPIPLEQAIETMREALNQGANFWNAGIFYGTPEHNSLHVLKAYFDKYPEDAEKVVLSIKGALNRTTLAPEGYEASVRRDIDDCLRILDGKKKIDIFEAARVDPKVPMEDTISYIQKYVEEGKVGAVGISEVSAASIHRAAKVTKVAGIEVELSLFSTDIFSNGIAKAAAEHDIPIIAYSPLGRGFLTGELRKPEDIPDGDFRKTIPKFQGDAFYQNLKLVDEVERIAKSKGVKAGQVALGWVLKQSKRNGNPTIIPIPGTSTKARLAENLAPADLTEQDLQDIDAILSKINIIGERYGGHGAAVLNG